MLELDTLHRYCSLGSRRPDSVCRIRIFKNGDAPVVIATEVPFNEGASITNLAEAIAAEVLQKHLSGRLGEVQPLIWIEHYPARGSCKEVFSVVTFADYRPYKSMVFPQKQQWRLGTPSWKYIPIEQVNALIGQDFVPETGSDTYYKTHA